MRVSGIAAFLLVAIGVTRWVVPVRAECATLAIDKEFERSTAVFVGRAIAQSISNTPPLSWSRATETTFEVEQVWRGEPAKTIRVQTCGGTVGRERITCGEGFRFEVGGRYVVFAEGAPLATDTRHHTAFIDTSAADATVQWLSRKRPLMRVDQAPTRTAERDAGEVYAAVIAAETPRQPGAPVLIAAATYRRPVQECRPTADEEANPWRTAIDNYVAVSQLKGTVSRNLPMPPARYAVLTAKDFKRRFPQGVGFLLLSRVGFDASGTRAVVHRIHARGTGGDAGDLFLEKQKDEWHLVQPPGVTGCGWIS